MEENLLYLLHARHVREAKLQFLTKNSLLGAWPFSGIGIVHLNFFT